MGELADRVRRIVWAFDSRDDRRDEIRSLATFVEMLERRCVDLESGVPATPPMPADGLDLRVAVERFENALIGQALAATGWNRTRAAALLGLNRTTLVEKLKARADAYPELAKHDTD